MRIGCSRSTLKRLEEDLETTRDARGRVLLYVEDVERLRIERLGPELDPRENAALAELARGTSITDVVLEHGLSLQKARALLERLTHAVQAQRELAEESAKLEGAVLLYGPALDQLRRDGVLPRDTPITASNLPGLLADWLHTQRAAMDKEVKERVRRGVEQDTRVRIEQLKLEGRREEQHAKAQRRKPSR